MAPQADEHYAPLIENETLSCQQDHYTPEQTAAPAFRQARHFLKRRGKEQV
jgi:hypothetical protein